jgi:hypothetical protein
LSRPSGLLAPTEVIRPIVFEDENPPLSEVSLGEQPFLIFTRTPSALEQTRVFVDEASLGLPVSTPERLREMAEALSFERCMVALAQLSAHVAYIQSDTKAQLKLAPGVFVDPNLITAIERLAKAESDELEIFPEQHTTIFQRLLTLYGHKAPLGEVAEDEDWLFGATYIGVSSLTIPPDILSRVSTRAGWLTYLIQNGTYNRTDEILSTMVRPQMLLREISAEEDLLSNPDYCDLNTWHKETFGFDLDEQFALGFGIIAGSKMLEESLEVGDRSVLDRGFLHDLIERLDGNVEQGEELLSAPREWYREQFVPTEDGTSRAAWDRIPFEKRPLLRLQSGQLLLISPRALECWLGDGFYHRSLAAAHERNQAPRFQRFYGALVEGYARRLLEHVDSTTSPLELGRVFGEQRYGLGGGSKSPDIAVDCGTDLVLFEVTSGRFTLQTLLEGSPEQALKDLGRLLFDKAKQLDQRITDFLAGRWQLPGVNPEHVRKIWPVVVTVEVLQGKPLWDELRDRLDGVFSQPKTQRLTVFDLTDIERLAALVEHGHGLAELISQKAQSPYAELDFRRFVMETPSLKRGIRLSLLEQRWLELARKTARSLGFEADETPT